MKILKTPIKGLLVFKSKKFDDSRGYFREVLLEKIVNKKFKFNVVSMSKKNVIRGLHFQKVRPQAKFISVIKGKIVDVAVDIRKNSPTYGKWVSEILSEDNHNLLYVPEGFAHGFCVLSKEADVYYKVSNEYSPKDEGGIIWNDPSLNIEWPVSKPIVSSSDSQLPLFDNLDDYFV